MSSEWSDPARVAEYLGRELPHRGVAEALLLDALPARVEREADLGTGSGRLLSLLLSRFPAAELTGYDTSAPMLALARERFCSSPGVRLAEHDLAEPLPGGPGSLDAVVSSLAIHHLEHPRKRALFSEVLALLGPGGVFVDLDLATSPTPELHAAFRRAIGREEDDPTDRLAGLEEQLAWLRDAGFADVDCRFKWRELTLLVAVRPD